MLWRVLWVRKRTFDWMCHWIGSQWRFWDTKVVVVRNLGEETGSRILDELHLVSEFGR